MTLQTAINKIEERLASIPPSKRSQLFRTLDCKDLEKFQFFEWNARAFASGVIDLDTSQFIYRKLQNWDDTTLAERIAIHELILQFVKAGVIAK